MEITRDNLLALIKTGMARESLNITSLEREAGVPKDTIRDFLRGKTAILRADKLQKILKILQPPERVSVIGVAGTGGEIHLFGKDAKPELVDCPPGMEAGDVMAVRVEGTALFPVLQDGWIVYYTPDSHAKIPAMTGGWQVPYARQKPGKPAVKSKGKTTSAASLSALMGKPCIIRLKDGRTMLRTLKAGSRDRRYHLISYNAPDLKDVEVEWAAKIIFIKTE